MCSNLKHKALAYIMAQAREKRKTQEAQDKAAALAQDVSKGAAQIEELQSQQQQTQREIEELEKQKKDAHDKLTAEVEAKAQLLKEQLVLTARLRTAESNAEKGASADLEERANLKAMLEERESKMKNAAAELAEAKKREDEMAKRIATEKQEAEAL